MPTKYSIKPSSGESVFEAYQSVLSYLMGDESVYPILAKIAGADKYVSSADAEEEIEKTLPDENIIFNDGGDETHYKFYNSKTKKISDPYNLFQIPHSHGNCLFYAFYISSKFLNPEHNTLFPDKLIRISRFLTRNTYKGEKYIKVGKDKQLAYQCFVYNDFIIIKGIIQLLNTNKELMAQFKKVWTTLSDEEKTDYDIPLENYTCDQFIKELNAVFNNKIENTWKMTWEVVQIWDTNEDETPPPENTGIQGATKGEVNKAQYKLTEKQLKELKTF